MEELNNLFLVSIPAIALIMEALRSWVDKLDKLKPYWFWIAVGLSAGLSAVFSYLSGWDWTQFFLQAAIIYGGEHVLQQAWFKKFWPVIKAIIGRSSKG
jgi:uncharacterized membrane protein YjjP (DUF1212 family)